MQVGSSRKSAINSVLWHLGMEIPFVPNKKAGGYMKKKGYKSGGSISKPRGVGCAMRGYGKAMKGSK